VPGVPASPADPRLWSLLSLVALVVAIVGFVTGADFAWLALAASGVFFLVEQVLKRRGPAAG
jgi:O-antigen ligase